MHRWSLNACETVDCEPSGRETVTMIWSSTMMPPVPSGLALILTVPPLLRPEGDAAVEEHLALGLYRARGGRRGDLLGVGRGRHGRPRRHSDGRRQRGRDHDQPRRGRRRAGDGVLPRSSLSSQSMNALPAARYPKCIRRLAGRYLAATVWVGRVAWALLPLTAGPVLGDALDGLGPACARPRPQTGLWVSVAGDLGRHAGAPPLGPHDLAGTHAGGGRRRRPRRRRRSHVVPGGAERRRWRSRPPSPPPPPSSA